MGFILLYITQLTLFSLNDSQQIDIFERYFLCEEEGHNASNPCSRSEIEDLRYPSLEILVNTFASLFPVVNLIYVVNIQELKEVWRKWFSKPTFNS